MKAIACTWFETSASPTSHPPSLPSPPLTYLLSYLSQVSSRQYFQIRGQGAGLQDTAVLLLIVGFPKQDVVPQGGVLDPGLLGDVGHRTLGKERPAPPLRNTPWIWTWSPPFNQALFIIAHFILSCNAMHFTTIKRRYLNEVTWSVVSNTSNVKYKIKSSK